MASLLVISFWLLLVVVIVIVVVVGCVQLFIRERGSGLRRKRKVSKIHFFLRFPGSVLSLPRMI